MPNRTEITKVTSDAKTWARLRPYSIDGSAPRVWVFITRSFRLVKFCAEVVIYPHLATILVSIETVENPSRNGDPVIQRQPGFRGARWKIAPSWLGMGRCRG